MILSLLAFASAFLIEGLGTWISIIGLSSLFSADPIIIALAAALDIGKVVTVSFLYKRWRTAPRMLRAYMILATAVLMIITSAGAFGYLSAAFQGAIKDTKQQQVLVTAIAEEKAKLEARKKEIDTQIAKLPSNSVRGRQKLIAAFKGEADRITLRLQELDAELPKLRVQEIAMNTHAGPIVYISQAFDVSLEQAVKYVILVIIFVLDPLAIALLVAGNFLWETRARERRASAAPSGQPDKVTTVPLHETRASLAGAAPAHTALEVADPAEVPIARSEVPEDSAAIHLGPGPSPVHFAASQNVGEQPGVQSPTTTSSATVDGRLADANVAVTTPVDEPVPRPRDREQAIREKAYYIAEQRKFADGAPADDWVLAEKELEKDLRTVS